MFGLRPMRTELITSFVTDTDCAYVRLAASFAFCRSSSSRFVGGPSSNAVTFAAASFSPSAYKRASGSPTAAFCSSVRNTTQSRTADAIAHAAEADARILEGA